LKDNVRRCRLEASPRVTFGVPFLAEKMSCDVYAIAGAVRDEFRRAGKNPWAGKNCGSVLVTCLFLGFFMTVTAARVLGPIPLLSAPGADEDTRSAGETALAAAAARSAGETALTAAAAAKDKLVAALAKAREDVLPLFNRAPNINRRSFIGKPSNKAALEIDDLAAAAVALSQNVHGALERTPNPSTASVLDQVHFMQDLTCPGMPAFGYYQHLGIAIWHLFQELPFPHSRGASWVGGAERGCSWSFTYFPLGEREDDDLGKR